MNKWFHNQLEDEIINTDTGAKFAILTPGNWQASVNSNYEAEICFLGPIGGFWESEQADIREKTRVYSGTYEQCKDSLDRLSASLDAFCLPISQIGTPKHICEHCNKTVGIKREFQTIPGSGYSKTAGVYMCEDCYQKGDICHWCGYLVEVNDGDNAYTVVRSGEECYHLECWDIKCWAKGARMK